jgi:hypothetical protein
MKNTEKSLANKKVNVLSGTASFAAWKREVTTDLKMCGLLTGLEEPRSAGQLSAMSALRRSQWEFSDLLLISYLSARLGERQKLVCAECVTAADMWIQLHETYASRSAAAQHRLSDEWVTMTQRQGERLDDYLQRLRTHALVMRDAEIPKSDYEKKHRLLTGVSADYDLEKRIYATQDLSFEELCKKFRELAAIGGRPQTGGKSFSQGYQQANLARGSYGQSGGGQSSNLPNYCKVCGAESHLTWDCPTGLTRNKDARGFWIPRCFNCLEEGHMSKTCKQAKKSWGSERPTGPVKKTEKEGGDVMK